MNNNFWIWSINFVWNANCTCNSLSIIFILVSTSSCHVATPIRSIVWHILLRHRCKPWDHQESMSVAAAGTRGDALSSDQLLYNHTWCHPHLYISTFLGCVCSVPFSCGVCSGISIQSMCLMHHLLDTHLGFVVACGVQIAGAETTVVVHLFLSFSLGSDTPSNYRRSNTS